MEVEKEKKDKLAAARKKLNEYKMSRTAGKSTTSESKPADVPQIYQNLNTQATTFTIFNPAASDNNNVSTTDSYFVQPNHGSSEGVIASNTNQGFSHYDPQTLRAQLPAFSQQSAFSPLNASLFSSPSSVINSHQESPTVSVPSSIAFANSEHVLPETPTLFQTSQFGVAAENQPNVFENFAGITQLDVDTALSTEQQKSDSFAEPTMIGFETPQLVPVDESETKDYYASAPPMENLGVLETGNVQELDNLTESNYVNHQEELKSEIECPPEMIFETHTAANIHTDQHEASHVFASSLFSGPVVRDLDTVFSFCGTQAPSSSVVQADTSLVTDSSNPLVIPATQEQSIFEEIQSQVSFQAENESTDNNGPDDTPLVADDNDIRNLYSATTADFIQDAEINTINEPLASQLVDNVWESSASPLVEFQDSFVSEQELSVSEPINSSVVHEQLNGQVYDQMKSMQEALELQIEELRRENTYLLNRQTDLTSKIEDSEKLAHEFKLERDRIKEESMNASQAMRARINSLCEENQRIVKNSTEVGVDLRAKLEDKTRQLEEMQKAVIIVSQSKMDFAGRLDHELESVKELQKLLAAKDEEINSLRITNSELEEKLKKEQQKDAVIQQLQDQARHYQVQCETLQRELHGFRRQFKNPETESQRVSAVPSNADPVGHLHDEEHQGTHHDPNHDTIENPADLSIDATHHHSEECDHDHKEGHHDHGHDEHHHHDHGDHGHDEHQHHHDHGDHNDKHQHHHHHDHDEHHHHDHVHTDEHIEVVARRGPSDEVTEMKKTLHRLEWENSTFRNELDVLAVDAKQKKSYEEKCLALQDENEHLKKEVEQLEHVIIQLQGENDTIGDYITLYQSQKLALKECAKEKDVQLEQLAREREMLLRRLADLTALVKDLRDSKSESGSQCADDHINTLEIPIPVGGNKKQIEGKIRDLLTEISSSTLIENFHPCAVCSGRLMTV